MIAAFYAFLCKTCGMQFPPSATPPSACPICEDPRQYVGYNGQEWITPAELRLHHRNVFQEEEAGLHSFITEPDFAIGQRAFLVQTPEGNLLWDCLSLMDEETVEAIHALGGIQAIAISHPHYYTTMIDWSQRFGNAPVYLHEFDRQWVMRPDPSVKFWTGKQRDLFGGLRLLWTGGHFDGYQVAHWPNGAEGRGVILVGDQPQVCADRRWVTFMYSYPNYIPLGATLVNQIVAAFEPIPFDRLYGPFRGRTIPCDAKRVVVESAKRYIQAISY